MHVNVAKNRLRALYASGSEQEVMDFREEINREYSVDGGGVLLVMPAVQGYGRGEIYMSPRGVVTSYGLMQLALAARYAEKWLAGEVDDLPPSGPWVNEAVADIMPAYYFNFDAEKAIPDRVRLRILQSGADPKDISYERSSR